MTDPVKEQLSACLDGELSADELDLVLRQTERDPQLKMSMSRYATIGAALRSERTAYASKDFASRVAAAVAAEAAPKVAGKSLSAARWLRPVAGLAVAAGVAAVAIFVLRAGTSGGVSPAANQPLASSAPTTTPAPTMVTAAPRSVMVPDSRLTNYVVAHSEFSSPLGRRTVLSGVLTQDDSETLPAEPVETTAQPH